MKSDHRSLRFSPFILLCTLGICRKSDHTKASERICFQPLTAAAGQCRPLLYFLRATGFPARGFHTFLTSYRFGSD